MLDGCLGGLVVDVHLIRHVFVSFEHRVRGLRGACHSVLSSTTNVSCHLCEFVFDSALLVSPDEHVDKCVLAVR